ncbi:c5a4df97-44ee-446f-8346-35014d93becb [Thermothielavioides terrestris]|uniref:Elongator complex protein 5 n=1 Tax=Thermothielavioides terrestris TaxID=2587410 RepID=A0A3S4EXF7_9PEZI|nr:c5a4df97-44ee-446f-8346-35014d93becb [Thermothielavioides terrestris]
MAPSAQAHKRAHSLLLFEKLLNLRDAASPLNILLDTLEQGAQPLTHEFMRRAKIERAKIVYVSFATIKKPTISDVFIKARGKSLKALAAEIAAHVAPPRGASKDTPATPQKSLIIIDTLNPLASQTPHLLPSFFTSILPPGTSLVAVYHTDVPALPVASPVLGSAPLHAAAAAAEYLPDALTLLTHLATAVFRVSSLGHAVAARRARERSLAEPQWGLREGREGVLVGLRAGVGGADGRNGNGIGGDGNGNGETGLGEDGLVVEMEMRRKSGRAVAERFVLVQRTDGRGLGVVVMDDHPAFRKAVGGGEGEGEEEGMVATFNLSLTEKQRKDREGVVLPYFDAQVEVGGGEGGRILYEMGREDDFDEEEDEI